MSYEVDDTAATEAAIPETNTQSVTETVSAATAPLSLEDRMSALEQTVTQGLASVNASLGALAAHVSNVPALPSNVVRYDGPSDSLNIVINKGEAFLATPRIEALLAPLEAKGHIFTKID